MAAKSGQYAALFINSGSSTAASGEAMTEVGSTTEFYITDRTKSWWDTAHVPVFHCGGNVIAPSEIDYASGFATFSTWTTGAVTADVYWFTPEALGGCYGFSLNPKADTKEITCFPAELNNPTIWKSYVKTLMDWQGTAQRHFFYGKAWILVDCTADYSDMYWILKEWGANGNLRAINYTVGNNATLQVAYDAGTKEFTVTVGTTGTTPTSTAAAIKAHVDADPVLAALVDLEYKDASVNAFKVVDCTAANSDIKWTWKVPGTAGNSKYIEYLVAGVNTPLTVTYSSPTISVHVATNGSSVATSTALQVMRAAEATQAIRDIVTVENATANDGSGVVNAKTTALFAGGVNAGSGLVNAKSHTHFSGGRDLQTDFDNIGNKILFRGYLDTTTGSLEMISGVCQLVGVPLDAKLDSIMESDLTLQGIGRLKYHTV